MKKSNLEIQTKLMLIVMISLFPIVMGWFLYHYRDHFQLKTLNLGTLISPALQMNEFSAQDEKTKLWKIVYAPTACCDEQCQKTMFTLHQLRLVLGKDSRRVGLSIIENKICQKDNTHDFQRIDFTQQQYTQWEKSLATQAKNFQVNNKIYLVDPLGNMFMYYPGNVDAMHILNDLKRVLEVSQIG